jgi:DNA-binding LytR/AlgR family response regulator
MEQLNIAILEDNPILLKDLICYIEDLKLANIKVKAQKATDFIEKTKALSGVDAVVLDIDINGDSMNGIDVANHLNLPTLFISGKTKNYLNEIEDLRLFHEQPVEFLTKPIREDKLKLVFEKFERLISQQNNENTLINSTQSEYLVIKTREAKKQSIKVAEIAFLDTEPEDGNRIKLESGEEILTPRGNFSGFLNELPNYFIKINRSTIINAKKVDRFFSTDEIGIPIEGETETFLINDEAKESLFLLRPEFR